MKNMGQDLCVSMAVCSIQKRNPWPSQRSEASSWPQRTTGAVQLHTQSCSLFRNRRLFDSPMLIVLQISHHLFILWLRKEKKSVIQDVLLDFPFDWLPYRASKTASSEWTLQMIRANKADEEQITKGGLVG